MRYYVLFLPGILMLMLTILPRIHAAREAEREMERMEAERAEQAAQRAAAAERKKAIQAEKAARREAERAAKEADRQRRAAEKLAQAKELAEYRERALEAARALKEIELGKSALSDEPAAIEPTSEAPTRNGAFAGERVAFTGKLPGMTRQQAIEAVEKNGGRAFTKMPVGTTLLVVGDKPGMRKMDQADEWIGQVRKITAAQFFAMLRGPEAGEPVTVTPDEFLALIGA